MWKQLLLSVPALLGGEATSIETAAYLEAETLEVGGAYEIVVDVRFPDEVVASERIRKGVREARRSARSGPSATTRPCS